MNIFQVVLRYQTAVLTTSGNLCLCPHIHDFRNKSTMLHGAGHEQILCTNRIVQKARMVIVLMVKSCSLSSRLLHYIRSPVLCEWYVSRIESYYTFALLACLSWCSYYFKTFVDYPKNVRVYKYQLFSLKVKLNGTLFDSVLEIFEYLHISTCYPWSEENWNQISEVL